MEVRGRFAEMSSFHRADPRDLIQSPGLGVKGCPYLLNHLADLILFAPLLSFPSIRNLFIDVFYLHVIMCVHVYTWCLWKLKTV